jgi:hypothetical protein
MGIGFSASAAVPKPETRQIAMKATKKQGEYLRILHRLTT